MEIISIMCYHQENDKGGYHEYWKNESLSRQRVPRSRQETWIKMLIDHNPVRGKLALIENDFGEVNVDGALMEGEPLSLYELTAGCICCSLRGNFGDAVRAVAAAASPELLLIEPSGVAMASDVLSALKEPEEAGLCEVKGVVTLVDGEAAPM